MSLALLRSRGLDGMGAPEVTVEVHLANGLPAFGLVGLPDTEVREARDRVRAALITSGFEFPQRRITVNLAPADLPKEGGRFDLPIALGILVASGQVRGSGLEDYEFIGELSLSGELRGVPGALAHAIQAAACGRPVLLPNANADEAALVAAASVHAAPNLLAACAHLEGRALLPRHPRPSERAPGAATDPHASTAASAAPDLADVKGQAQARRALEVAAAGQHSLLMFGPPGGGKSMLAQRLPGLLPPLSESEALESATVRSLEPGFDPQRWTERPFRFPHHTASTPALVGGGSTPRPGEISLAHLGILFLDELPEFDRRVLESLREPLESGVVSISRAKRRAEFPARFQLVAAMNPCPCGYHGHPGGRCRCSPEQITRYLGRLSGPLLDRLDLILEVPAVSDEALVSRAAGESSASVRQRVERAHQRQQARQGAIPNARLSAAEVDRYCSPDPAGAALLTRALRQLDLSSRAYHRVLRVARSVADLAAAEQVGAAHVAEALQYRRHPGHGG